MYVYKNFQVLTDWNAFLLSNFFPRGPYESGDFYPEVLEELLRKPTKLGRKKSDNKNDSITNLMEKILKSVKYSENVRSNGFIPTLYRVGHPSLFLDLQNDTYVDTQGWGKGILYVVYYKEGEKPQAMNLGRLVGFGFSVI